MKRLFALALTLALALLPATALAANPFALPQSLRGLEVTQTAPTGAFAARVIARDAPLLDQNGRVRAWLSPGDEVRVYACNRNRAAVVYNGNRGVMKSSDLMSMTALRCQTVRASVVTDCKWPRGDEHNGTAYGYKLKTGEILYAAGLHPEGMIVVNQNMTAVGYINPKDIRPAPLPKGYAAS